MTEEKDLNEKESEAPVKFTGKFIAATGRRKNAVATVRLYQNGRGFLIVNSQKARDYFGLAIFSSLVQPLKLTGHLKDLNFSIKASGGGKQGQAAAVINGLAKTLIILDKELRPALKAKGWLTRDSRRKERKKPGLKKARRAPQWSKR